MSLNEYAPQILILFLLKPNDVHWMFDAFIVIKRNFEDSTPYFTMHCSKTISTQQLYTPKNLHR